MSAKSPTCTAVVVTYNSAATIGACLTSLRSSGVSSVLVIDNNSSDATRTIVARYPVTLYARPVNMGFAAACNFGAQHTATDFLFFLNPDAVVAPRALSTALAYGAAHPQVAVMGLRLIDERGAQQLDNFGSDVTVWRLLSRKLMPPRVAPVRPTTCAWVSGGAMVVRRRAWEQAGGFDAQYFLYWEDVDFCKRLRSRGWQIVWLPQAVATHQRGQSLSDRRRKTALYDASADRYFRTHYAGWVWYLQHYIRRFFRFFSPQVR